MPLDYYRLGLLGYPLGHSRSPQLHQAALAKYGLAGEYRLYPVTPEPDGAAQLDGFAQQVRRGELHGLNVTIPHKQAMRRRVDQLTITACAVGAVNTLYRHGDGLLVGDNTDVPGFLTDLQELISDARHGAGRVALVLGAGGSARAIVYALASRGWSVHVAARRPEQAEDLLQIMRIANQENTQNKIFPLDSDRLQPLLPSVALVVNTTPVGMFPHPDASPWPAGLPLPLRAAVYDLVYNPSHTRLIQAAAEAGLPFRSGGGMLAAQAALAFAHWTGLEPPFAVMRESMEEQST